MKITYDEKTCKISLKTVCANIIKGLHIKRNTYLQITSIGFSDKVWEIFASLTNITNKRNKKLNFFADPVLIKINCKQRLSQNGMPFFDDLVIQCHNVYNIDYRGKTRFVIDV